MPLFDTLLSLSRVGTTSVEISPHQTAVNSELVAVNDLATVATPPEQLPASCFHPTGDCNWYLDCLDKRFAYGPSSYAVNYGLKYCNRFKSLTPQDLTPSGLQWRDATMVCLQQKLVPLLSQTSAPTSEQITSLAFDSHPGCYTNNGSVGICSDPHDWATIATTVDKEDLLTMKSAKQSAAVAQLCGTGYAQQAWSAIQSLFH